MGARGKFEDWLTEDGLIKITGWARNGLTDEQIAKNIGCSYSTLREWKNRFPAFSAALKKGKEVVDLEVEAALYRRALGYSYVEETKELRFNRETGQKELVTVKSVVKIVPPDTTAQIFWLKNRRPDRWRDKQEVKLDGELKAEKTKLDDLIRQMRDDEEPS